MSDLKKKKENNSSKEPIYKTESEMWKTNLWLSKEVTVSRSIVSDSL